MAGLTVEITYGNAIYLAAKEEGMLDSLREELKEIQKLFKDNPELMELLCNPSVITVKKKKIVEKVFKGNVLDLNYNFINVLIDKRRLGDFKGIVKEFNKLVAEKEGVASGIIYSMMPIGQKRIELFEKEVESLLNKKVNLKNELDETLLGGVSIKVEGKIIDASLKSRLKGLSKDLLNE